MGDAPVKMAILSTWCAKAQQGHASPGGALRWDSIPVYDRRRKRLDFKWAERPLIFSPCVAPQVSCLAPSPWLSSGWNSPTDLYPRMAIFRDFGCGISRSGYRIQSSGSTATSNRMASKFKRRKDSTYRPPDNSRSPTYVFCRWRILGPPIEKMSVILGHIKEAWSIYRCTITASLPFAM